MENKAFFIMLAVMAVTTYLVRAIPFTLFRRKIKNKRVKIFFDYIPYSVLSAMTFPAILYSTSSMLSAAAGALTALVLAYKGKNLLVVALATCTAAFLVSLLEMYLHF
ncbi:MAG: AzlD domain-containing protein [Clostridiales bacterium]|nr:AzlD domain-containing protein [Clostridiales bacterium]